MPDCQSFNQLKVVEINDCDFKDVSGLSSCTAVEMLEVTGCRWLERLPDLYKLSRLKLLFQEMRYATRCALCGELVATEACEMQGFASVDELISQIFSAVRRALRGWLCRAGAVGVLWALGCTHLTYLYQLLESDFSVGHEPFHHLVAAWC